MTNQSFWEIPPNYAEGIFVLTGLMLVGGGIFGLILFGLNVYLNWIAWLFILNGAIDVGIGFLRYQRKLKQHDSSVMPFSSLKPTRTMIRSAFVFWSLSFLLLLFLFWLNTR